MKRFDFFAQVLGINFQTSIRNFLFGKLFFPLIIRNFFLFLENLVFLDKYEKFFQASIEISHLVKYKEVFLWVKIIFFRRV